MWGWSAASPTGAGRRLGQPLGAAGAAHGLLSMPLAKSGGPQTPIVQPCPGLQIELAHTSSAACRLPARAILEDSWWRSASPMATMDRSSSGKELSSQDWTQVVIVAGIGSVLEWLGE